MDVNNWMRCECSDEGTPWSTHTQKIHYSSTCSHAAEGEIAAKNCKCKHAGLLMAFSVICLKIAVVSLFIGIYLLYIYLSIFIGS
jgi:hypothetical protein